MQKEIKLIIEKYLYNYDNNDEQKGWNKVIKEYYKSVKETSKGVVINWRYFKRKNYWRCLRELQKINVYNEKDKIYRIVNEIIVDLAFIASYEGLLNPYEFE